MNAVERLERELLPVLVQKGYSYLIDDLREVLRLATRSQLEGNVVADYHALYDLAEAIADGEGDPQVMARQTLASLQNG